MRAASRHFLHVAWAEVDRQIVTYLRGPPTCLETFRNALLTSMATPGDDEQTFEVLNDVVTAGADAFGDPGAMADLLQEMVRVGFNDRVQMMVGDIRWRAYVSVAAATAGEVGDENRYPGRHFAPFLELIGAWFGIRPVPPLSWLEFANIGVAVTRWCGTAFP